MEILSWCVIFFAIKQSHMLLYQSDKRRLCLEFKINNILVIIKKKKNETFLIKRDDIMYTTMWEIQLLAESVVLHLYSKILGLCNTPTKYENTCLSLYYPFYFG